MSNLLTNQQAPLSSAALNETLHQQVEHLVRQFNTLITLASSGSSSSQPGSPSEGQSSSQGHVPPSLPSAAVQTYRITAETQALITSIESLTALTRRMKEAWVFGELETIGASKDGEERTEKTVREVVEGFLRSG
ncbi:MAG: hypothetical protein GOMPHAMPRED_003122 [Gomphillus americanus]|uniref:Mediator of RNA polymerase II transcription subunit 22 n=1 Tax=Gomphillus americanus TaxID=1940652 RepID=A0A8H3EHE9_9LECA|nr:MAG: hypothetical protein GOMPHAMPRED_003122 [Gomphillus americanus]